MSDNAHLDDLILVAVADGTLPDDQLGHVVDHLASCGLCRARAGNIDQRDEGTSTIERTPDLSEARIPPDVLMERLGADQQPLPTAGQLWRLRRDDAADTAVIIDVADEQIVIAPATFDPEMADEYTLVVDAEASPLGLPLAIWVAERTTVDRDVLDSFMGDLPDAPETVEVLMRIHRAYVADERVDFAPVGQPIYASYDARTEYRSQLRNRFTRLVAPFADLDEPAETPAEGEFSVADKVRDVLEQLKDVKVEDDYREKEIADAIRPLRSVCIAQVLDVRVRVCIAATVTDLEELEDPEVVRATDLLALFGDCEYVAVVANTDKLDTVIPTPPDLFPARVVPDAQEVQKGWRLRDVMPLELAFRRLIEEYVPDDEPFEPPDLESLRDGVETVARHAASNAIGQQTSQEPRIEAKQQGIATLSPEDAKALADLIEAVQQEGPIDISERIEQIVEAAA